MTTKIKNWLTVTAMAVTISNASSGIGYETEFYQDAGHGTCFQYKKPRLVYTTGNWTYYTYMADSFCTNEARCTL